MLHRYEIWCIARATATRSCVLHCDAPAEACCDWNAARAADIGAGSYSPAVFDDLAGRFERPDARSRWDSPLFECVALCLFQALLWTPLFPASNPLRLPGGPRSVCSYCGCL